ncbi:hypothetical protein [Streptomyces goshikiensis]|uniref:hypothetical protein n=1 Tax=Streptomyces goshikiensis TaxID=1942 RepID=UPI0036D13EB5
MTMPTSDPAEQTAASVADAYPGLRQVEPFSIGGEPLAVLRLAPNLTARYRWGGYDVHVRVGPEDHLRRDDPDDASLQRQVRAHATLLVGEVVQGKVRGHVEWEVFNPRPEIIFPAAFSAAAASLDDPRLASAVLATVALALDYARIATGRAGRQAAEAAEEAQWERERPEGMRRSKWLREMRAARDARLTEPGTR